MFARMSRTQTVKIYVVRRMIRCVYLTKHTDLGPYLAGVFAGAFYAPVSAPANRGITPAGAFGISIDFGAYNAGGGPPVYAALWVQSRGAVTCAN